MRNVKGVVAAVLLVSATGCMDLNGLSGTPGGYGGYPSSGYYGQPAYSGGYYGQPASSGYYSQPTYYPQQQTRYVPVPVASQPQVVTQTQYVPVPTPSARSSGGRDRNNNGVPDWKERDRNGDGIPDSQQRRRGPND